MESYMNLKNFGEEPQNQGTSTKPAVCTPLVRQSSVCNITFDEFQNNLLESGKDFGSMNMDEFLKNLWTVEETQVMTNSTVVGKGSNNLQRQSSLTLPRMLTQKTVDEVWKELSKENGSEVKDVKPNSHQEQKQLTLGETTLEEFLSRAGIVKEDFLQTARWCNNGYHGDGSSQPNNNMTIRFQQSAQNNIVKSNQPSSVPMNMSGISPSQQQLRQPLNPANVNFTSSMPMTNYTQLSSPLPANQPVFKTGIAEPLSANQSVYRYAVKMDSTMGSPGKNNGDTSSVSPPSYMLGGVGQGGKSGVMVMEKAVERRHKRMIKNRESAARSRARKQAYTFELEAEIATLKVTNHKLQEKQNEIMEMQKNQVTETEKTPWESKRQCLKRTLTETEKTSWGSKRQCLKRTLTGPW